ncbi:hypothetical protein M436DRAFT_53593 [Aureobasidium namibiae CBS 147.97]|uniref:Myb-like domain-containing protein n=1 Tax=Aureobasidium namibiae CBS 147.97 TaxID=1043004 RepID=A0A074WBQ7_9PEZI|nr:uncharacterized protein M436DRAFT_53593 [Aureobasidium namibiae CBS 147.97]KEQ70383.1 hypothetical protein M436DRAFT_53593 [Aureobasidium namibiae CBS 147.97]
MARTRSQSREPNVEPQPTTRQVRRVDGALEPLVEYQSENEDDDNASEGRQSADIDEEEEEISDFHSAPIDDTFSQTELQQLDPDEMESNLEELNAQARKLLGCFKTRTGQPDELESLIRQSQDPESRQRQKADGCRASLAQTQTTFTLAGEYLKLDTILRALLRKRSTQPLPKASRAWRPDDVIHKANLAVFVHIAITQADDGDLADALVTADQDFASPFVRGFTRPGAKPQTGYSTLVSETFEFALELRTQLLVIMLNNANPTQDTAAGMIQSTMLNFDADADDYEEEMGAMLSLQTALSHSRHAKGWEHLDPHALETDKYAEKIIQRTEEIRRLLFSGIDNPFVDTLASLDSGLIRLQERFPREQFQKHLLKWSNLRLSEIDDSIRKLGGIDEIVGALEDEIRQRLDNPDAYVDEDQEDREPLSSIESSTAAMSNNTPPVPTSSTKIPARPSVLFRGRPGTSTSAPTSATARKEPGIARNDAQVTEAVASSAALTQDRPRLTGKLAIANARDEQERQKRRFIDPQPNGVRISDDMLESQSASQRRLPDTQEMEIDPVLSGEVEDPSEDEGYQQDQRNLPGRRLPPRSSTVPYRAPAQAESTQPERRHIASELDTPNKRQRQNPGQLVVPYQATADDDVNSYKIASTITRLNQASTYKPQRGRKPWTDEQVGALVRLIRDHGISFAHLKRIDDARDNPALEDRTPEDFRFKAREMKVKYLMSHKPLPENMELIRLGKKEIEKVNTVVFYEQEPQRERARIVSVSPRASPE